MSNKTKSNLYLDIISGQTNLSFRTKETYIRNMMFINPNPKNLNFLSDVKSILSKFEDKSKYVRKSYLSSICAMFKYYDGKKTKKLEKAYAEYKLLLTDINADISKTINILSNDKKENWLSSDEIISKQKLYKKRYNQIIKKNYEYISYDEFLTVLDYLILSLYTLIPPRRENDYFLMFVNTDSEDLNSLDIKKRQFIFREYKDKRALGTQIINIPNELYNIITKYMSLVKYFFQEYVNNEIPIKFLIKPNGKPIIRGNIRLILTKIFEKPVGPNSLRRSYATEEFKPLLDKMKNSASLMGTSVHELQYNYVKNNAPVKTKE